MLGGGHFVALLVCLVLILAGQAPLAAEAFLEESQSQAAIQVSPIANAGAKIPSSDPLEATRLHEEASSILTAEHVSSSQLSTAIDLLQRAQHLGHAPANLALAKLFFFGSIPNLEPDFTRSAAYLDHCTDPECHYLLGVLHANGLGGKTRSLAHALAYFGVASRRGSDAGSLALAYRYANGIGLQKACTRARDLYYEVGERMATRIEEERIRAFPKHSRLSDDLSERGPNASVDVVEFYQYNADSGDVSAQLFLGQVFYLGIGGIQRNLPLARHYFAHAAERGSISALAYLGQMDLYGEGIEKPDYRKAYHSLRKASKEKNVVALNGLGIMYWRGYEVLRDLEEAAKYFKQAAELEHAEANYNLAMVYKELDPLGNEDRIFNALVAGLRNGFVLANFELVKLNMGRDLTCSLALYLLQNMLDKHFSLELLERAKDEYYAGYRGWALSKYLYLAEQGFESAQYNLAYILESMAEARSHDQSLRRRALMWWVRAANHGDVKSRLMVGDYFYYGWGLGAPDPVAAAANYHLAVEKKSPQAAFNLGYMHEHGIGVPLDYNMARRFYDQASSLGELQGQKEAWWPAHAALYKMQFMSRVKMFSRLIHGIPTWLLPLTLTTILVSIGMLLAMRRFELLRQGRNRRRTSSTRGSDSEPRPASEEPLAILETPMAEAGSSTLRHRHLQQSEEMTEEDAENEPLLAG